MTRSIYGALMLSLSAALACGDRALAVIATDNASNAPYNDDWQVGDNGGSGFAAWSTINNSGGGGSGGGFLANNNTESQINVGGDAWGVFGHSGGVGQAIRSFSVGMNPTEAFFIDMDNGSIDTGGTVGFGLRNSSGNNLVEFFFVGGQSTYRYNSAGGSVSTGVGFTNQGLRLQLTLTDADSFTLAIDRLVDGVGTNVTTVSGDLINALGGQVISQLRLFNANAGSPNSHNVFYNNLLITVVPEASSLYFGALACAAAVSATCWRRRSRRMLVGSASMTCPGQ
jgi:hypothetical protein